ncbi:PTS sugar transporter subunit IIA [Bacillus songklensis]|uniref:PTS sugar transporter subunit IIA n=1 Tax=Bacillus songklensis TaxID=1069116 RepID=UPI00367112C5
MLNELLTPETIMMKTRVKNWEDGIRTAAFPLLQNRFITEQYVQSMIENVKKFGPYIVIVPKVAIPHARPDNGVLQISMSLLHLEEPVYFSEEEEHAVHLIFVLAAIDDETHLKALSQLSDLLMEEENINKILQTKNKQEILVLIDQYSSS